MDCIQESDVLAICSFPEASKALSISQVHTKA